VWKKCYQALTNLSLVITTHQRIWKEENLHLLYRNVNELRFYIKEADISCIYIHRERILNTVRIFTNCLLNDEALASFEINRPIH